MRPFAKLSEIHEGDWVELDDGFTCVKGFAKVFKADAGLAFPCGCGTHYLDGQLDDEDQDTLVGVYGPIAAVDEAQ